ncbi:MAG: tetraacyldisaccharide 4'-kinase [Leptospirales bacterium]|jgi:tetraacyldisaccharide 4'-kinase
MKARADMFDLILRSLGTLYLWAHRRTYSRRLATQTVFEQLYVVSVGNLSAGGTGKTPVALALAGHLRERDVATLAVLRGYGGSASKSKARSGTDGGLLVSDGSRRLASVEAAGDEALLFARSSGLRVAVGRDRVSAILNFAGDARVVLLDDAFQNPLVGRDHELVLLDALVSVDRMRVFPGGRFRDPPEALSRADTILLTRVDLAPAGQLAALERLVREVAPGVPVFRGRHKPAKLAIGALEGSGESRVGAFCGLGNPAGFFASVAAAPNQFKPVVTRAFPDHHPYRLADIRGLFREADRSGHSDLPFVTSAKDFVRLEAVPDLPPEFRSRIHVLEIEFEVLEDRGAEFYERVLGPALDSRD